MLGAACVIRQPQLVVHNAVLAHSEHTHKGGALTEALAPHKYLCAVQDAVANLEVSGLQARCSFCDGGNVW